VTDEPRAKSKRSEMMAQKKSALEIKYEKLYQSFRHADNFTVAEANQAWNSKLATTYWNLSKLNEAGKIIREQKGTYAFPDSRSNWGPMPSSAAARIHEILQESGYNYSISGLDVLLRFMQHIPDQYPVIAFVESGAIDEIANRLAHEGMTIVTGQEHLTARALIERNQMQNIVLLYQATNFTHSKDGFEMNEKAFVDLYMEVTRRAYPLPMQELARIYLNMSAQGAIHRGKLLRIAHERNIRSEMALIADIRRINPLAIKLAEIIKGEE